MPLRHRRGRPTHNDRQAPEGDIMCSLNPPLQFLARVFNTLLDLAMAAGLWVLFLQIERSVCLKFW